MKIYLVEALWKKDSTRLTTRAFHGQLEMLSAIEEKCEQDFGEGTKAECKIGDHISCLGLEVNSVDVTIKRPNFAPFHKSINFETVELE